MVLAIDASATVKMTLITNSDNDGNWVGTDGPDTYFKHIQGTNSESWQCAKSSNTDADYSLSSLDISGSKIRVNVWISSNVSDNYTNIDIYLETDVSNYLKYVLASTSDRAVVGIFQMEVLDANGGAETGTFDPTDLNNIRINIIMSGDGIRAIPNNWIDAIYWGTGLTFDGSSTGTLMFTEAAAIDQNVTNEWGVLDNTNEQIFVRGDLVFDDDGGANTQASSGENLIFLDTRNGNDAYEFTLIGTNNTVTFTNSNIIATGTARFTFDSSGTISSFDMSGGGLKKASSVIFKSGQTITDVNFTECGPVDPNAATLDGCNFISTLATGITEGALVINVGTEAEACDNISFSDYTGATDYAVFVDASVTSFTMDNWQFDDPNNTTSYALYWAGTSGTLTISTSGGTNLVTAGCTAASGGTVSVISGVDLTLTVKDPDGDAIVGARCLMEAGNGDGAAPFEDTVTITSVGTLATVTHTAHGLTTGQMVAIRNSTIQAYNGVFVVTVIDGGEYDYTMLSDPASPATGTIDATQVFMSEITIAGGIATQSFAPSGTQAYRGVVRSDSVDPYYKDVTFTGADVSQGLDIPIQMGLDQ